MSSVHTCSVLGVKLGGREDDETKRQGSVFGRNFCTESDNRNGRVTHERVG